MPSKRVAKGASPIPAYGFDRAMSRSRATDDGKIVVSRGAGCLLSVRLDEGTFHVVLWYEQDGTPTMSVSGFLERGEFIELAHRHGFALTKRAWYANQDWIRAQREGIKL